MSVDEITRLTAESLFVVLLVSGPVLLVSLGVGLLTGVMQASTQVQEQSLSAVPKLVAIGITLAIGGGWMGGEIVRFTESLWMTIPSLVP